MKCRANLIYKQSLLFSFIAIYLLLFCNPVAQAKVFVISVDHVEKNPEDKRYVIPDKHIENLESDLKEKTGLKTIRFDEKGKLVYDRSDRAQNGSEKLRRTIVGAIEDEKNIFHIGDYSSVRNIHFAETDSGTIDVLSKMTYYRVKIDYRDFKNCRRYTPKKVLKAFTMAIILFHEIDHKVSYDPSDPIPAGGVRPDKSSDGIRGVIENTNMIRKELSLILRKSDQHNGELYRGLIDFYKNTFHIRFVNIAGERRNLRWKIERKRT